MSCILISGPLGTIAGIYETAIDELSSRQVGDKKIRPKLLLVPQLLGGRIPKCERYSSEMKSRCSAARPDRRDSFFAKTEPSTVTPARLYIGVAAQGRSLKVVLAIIACSIERCAHSLQR